MRGGEKIVRLSTKMLGDHNIENIVGVSAMLLEKKLLSPEELAAGMRTFQGVKRRMELLSPSSRVPVYEGFGSSYEKARSAIDATKLHFPDRRLIIVFEPHTFTWRNRAAIAAYDDVFAGASKIFIFEPASQGAGSHAQLSQDEIVARTRAAEFRCRGDKRSGRGVAETERCSAAGRCGALADVGRAWRADTENSAAGRDEVPALVNLALAQIDGLGFRGRGDGGQCARLGQHLRLQDLVELPARQQFLGQHEIVDASPVTSASCATSVALA